MISQKKKIFVLFLFLGDLGATVLSFFLSYWLRRFFPASAWASLFPLAMYLRLSLFILPVWFTPFWALGLYRNWVPESLIREAWTLCKAVFLSLLLAASLTFLLKYHFVSRVFLILFSVVDIILILVSRLLVRSVIKSFAAQGRNRTSIVIVGEGPDALLVADTIARHHDWGLGVLGFLLTRGGTTTAAIGKHRVLGWCHDFPEIVDREVVDEVIFAVPPEELKTMAPLFLLCEERGITTRTTIGGFPHEISKIYLENLEGIPLLTFKTTPASAWQLFVRRILDITGSAFLLTVLSPAFLALGILIKLESSGPVIYRQQRCGLNGRRFTMYKFRSMVADADQRREALRDHNLMGGPVFKMRDDPRVTRIGRVLRKTSLDELPQLVNVLKGDMSMVGPRPPIPEEVERYEGWQRRRLSMKPGITGLWQIKGRNQIDFDDWMRLDLEYIDNWSLWNDVKILLKTIPAVLTGRGAM